MIYVEAPNEIAIKDRFPGRDPIRNCDHRPILFIAGGISGCRNWQRELCDLIRDLDIIVVNPRRSEFEITSPSRAREQIKWEYRHLRMSDMISFWFARKHYVQLFYMNSGHGL